MRVVVLVLALAACVNTQHASVPLANNPNGADCYSSCIAATAGSAAVDCVAACPGATRDSGDCAGALGCVEDRVPRRGATTWLIIAAVASVLLIYAISGAGASDPGAP